MKKITLLIYMFFSVYSYSQTAIQLNNSGMKKYNQKDYNNALLDFNKAIDKDSKLAIAYYNRGLIYSRIEEYKKAISDYDIAIKIDPTFSIVYGNRGNAKDALKDYSGAIKDYNLYINFNPKDANVYNDRGFAKLKLKDFENAIMDFDKAISINPKYAIAYYNRGTSKYKSGKKEAGCDDFKKASALGFSIADSTISSYCTLFKKDPEKDLFNPSYKELKTKGKMVEYFDSIGCIYSNFKYNVAAKIPKKWNVDQGLTKHMIFRAYEADSAFTFSINVIDTKYNVQKIFDKEYNKSKNLFKNKFVKATQTQLNTQIYDVYDKLTYLKNRKSIRWEYKFIARGDDYELEMISIIFQVMIDNLTYTFSVSAPTIFYNKNPRFFNTIFNGIHFMPDKTKLDKILIGE